MTFLECEQITLRVMIFMYGLLAVLGTITGASLGKILYFAGTTILTIGVLLL